MEEVYQFLKKCGVYYLATIEGDQPRVRPFGTAEVFENHLYILTGKKKDVSKQIQKNPKVEICASIGEVWIRITGILERDERISAKKNMLDKNPHLRVGYSEDDDNTEVLYFKSGTAVICSLEGEKRTFQL